MPGSNWRERTLRFRRDGHGQPRLRHDVRVEPEYPGHSRADAVQYDTSPYSGRASRCSRDAVADLRPEALMCANANCTGSESRRALPSTHQSINSCESEGFVFTPKWLAEKIWLLLALVVSFSLGCTTAP